MNALNWSVLFSCVFNVEPVFFSLGQDSLAKEVLKLSGIKAGEIKVKKKGKNSLF